MARPQFGTTRGQMAVMHAVDDGKMLREWLEGMAANDIRLFDGNAAVAKSVASGELYVGLTDSDDAINGMRQGWPIGVWMVDDRGGMPAEVRHMGHAHFARAMELPNTTGLVRGASHGTDARLLVDFLLSKDCGEMLSAGEACAMKFGPTFMPELIGLSVAEAREKGERFGLVGVGPYTVDYEKIADHVEGAMKVCDEVLKGR
jgi:iron(III) transport system substrate-binding protein